MPTFPSVPPVAVPISQSTPRPLGVRESAPPATPGATSIAPAAALTPKAAPIALADAVAGPIAPAATATPEAAAARMYGNCGVFGGDGVGALHPHGTLVRRLVRKMGNPRARHAAHTRHLEG